MSDVHTRSDLSLDEVLRRLAMAGGEQPRQSRRMGRVRHFDDKKGYGFITPDGGGPDVFFCRKIVQGEVRVGYRVEFDVEQGDKGPRAKCVCITFEL